MLDRGSSGGRWALERPSISLSLSGLAGRDKAMRPRTSSLLIFLSDAELIITGISTLSTVFSLCPLVLRFEIGCLQRQGALITYARAKFVGVVLAGAGARSLPPPSLVFHVNAIERASVRRPIPLSLSCLLKLVGLGGPFTPQGSAGLGRAGLDSIHGRTTVSSFFPFYPFLFLSISPFFFF